MKLYYILYFFHLSYEAFQFNLDEIDLSANIILYNSHKINGSCECSVMGLNCTATEIDQNLPMFSKMDTGCILMDLFGQKRELYLSGYRIDDFPIENFRNTSYQSLYLKNMDIKSSDKNSFSYLSSLESLIIENSRINFLAPATLIKLDKLNNIWIKNSSMRSNTASAIINHVVSLKISSINFESNYLSEVPSIRDLPFLTFLMLPNQNGHLKELKNYQFEKVKTLTSHLFIDITINYIRKFGSRTFCWRQGRDSFIKIRMNSFSLRNMDLCILSQMRPPNKTYKIELEIDDSDSSMSELYYKELCSCELKMTASENSIELTGVCDKIFPSDCIHTISKDCSKSNEFNCLK